MSRTYLIRLLLVAAIGATQAGVTDAGPLEDSAKFVTPAAKRDNGLGELGSYTTWDEPWLYLTPAEKLDSGLGELPPFSEWKEPWLYATPAEKLDSGLGELPPFSEWKEPWLYATPPEKLDSGLGQLPAEDAKSVRHAKRP